MSPRIITSVDLDSSPHTTSDSKVALFATFIIRLLNEPSLDYYYYKGKKGPMEN